MFHSPLCCPHFAMAFLLNFSAHCAVVPGFSQVSGGRMDLFCCFGSPISVGSHGKGWGGSTTQSTSPTTLMCPRSAPLLYAALGLVHIISSFHFHQKCFNFKLEQLFFFHNDHECMRLISICNYMVTAKRSNRTKKSNKGKDDAAMSLNQEI